MLKIIDNNNNINNIRSKR